MAKRLILSVVSSQRNALGANYSHTFTTGVGSIGRDEACEWQLPDSAVSRRHAAVRLLNGTFFIEDFSTNGTYVGGQDESHRLLKGQPRPLRDGDLIIIGEYQIVAALEDAAIASPPDAARPDEATALDVPPQSSLPPSIPPVLPPVGAPDSSLGRPAPAAFTPAPGGEVDPLKLLGAAPSGTSRPGAHEVPPVALDALQTGRGLDEPMPPLSSLPPAGSGGGQIPADWWKEPAEPAAPPAVPPPPEPVASAPLSAGPAEPPLPPAARADDDALVRTLVAGLMDVLAARAEIKRRFRVSMTMIQARENNPLKFAVDVDEAMAKLFGGVSSGYLGPSEAFEEAFRDLKAHQLAMLAAMREAFERMLNQFDPHRLEARFEKAVGKGKLPFAKDRHWRLYKELYDELTADAEDSFHRLFGNVFAATYEQEMQKLTHRFKQGE